MENYAFIDSQNVNLGIQDQGWKLDFQKFRVYLREKYNVEKAFIFIGYVDANKWLYEFLERIGYVCIFKPSLVLSDGKIKGNCDAELVLHTMIQYSHFDQAILVSGDGDFYCLVEYLVDKQKLRGMLVPNQKKYSALYKRRQVQDYIRFMSDLEKRLSYKKEKTP